MVKEMGGSGRISWGICDKSNRKINMVSNNICDRLSHSSGGCWQSMQGCEAAAAAAANCSASQHSS
jgi:hypothetical protein